MTSTALTENRPTDFDGFWDSLLSELARMPAVPELEPDPLHSTEYADMYNVRLTSVGPYRIFAYLSVPHGSGPFPTRYYLPRYGSVVEPIPQGMANAQRNQYVTFSIGVRGQRRANEPFAAAFPGLLTHGIDSPANYAFRGIVADCCRGLEYLLSRPEVDPAKVVAMGNDLALFTAALCPQVTHLICTPTLFHASGDLAPRTDEYPLEEFNDYLRHESSKSDAVRRTLSYFDLRWFAPRLKRPSLIMGAAAGELLDGDALDPLLRTASPGAEFHAAEHSTYKDGLFVEEWLTEKFGLERPVLPEHWQS